MTMVLRETDRVPVEIGDVTFMIKPLNYLEKMDILSSDSIQKGDYKQGRATTIKAMKYGIKDVKGLTTLDGAKYKLNFDENGCLTDECVTELLNCEFSAAVIYTCYSFVYGIPETITNFEGKVVEGVKIKKPISLKRKKKSVKQ